jgi:hypothetical protein
LIDARSDLLGVLTRVPHNFVVDRVWTQLADSL